MGRIKSAAVKRTAENLSLQEKFSDNFEDNKKIINGIVPSKKTRNKIAGYITKLTKISIKEKSSNLIKTGQY